MNSRDLLTHVDSLEKRRIIIEILLAAADDLPPIIATSLLLDAQEMSKELEGAYAETIEYLGDNHGVPAN